MITEHSLYLQFFDNLNGIDNVYESAIFGVETNKFMLLLSLEKIGSKSAKKRLKTEKISDEIKAIIDGYKKSRVYHNIEKLSKKQVKIVMPIWAKALQKQSKELPQFAREQTIISYTTQFEGFVNDLIRDIFYSNLNTLKSDKSSLKDYELVESIKENNLLDRLISSRLSNLMYGSVESWFKFFKEKGFKTKCDSNLVELFLVRNCLIHNNKKVSKELNLKIKKGRYILGKNIKILEIDLKRYRKIVEKTAGELYQEHVGKKVKKRKNRKKQNEDKRAR